MKEHPILFSPAMREALQEGRKTQTRRAFKKQPEHRENESVPGKFGTFFHGWNLDHPAFEVTDIAKYCPYGEIGGRRPNWKIVGRLWVKETFFAFGEWNEISAGSNRFTFYRHHEKERPSIPLPVKFLDNPPKQIETGKIPGIIGWYKKPSIFLERRDSRIDLEITNIRVERVQDISEEDAEQEGVRIPIDQHDKPLVNVSSPYSPLRYIPPMQENETVADVLVRALTFRAHFAGLWDSINKKRGFCWELTPWVWVITFEVV